MRGLVTNAPPVTNDASVGGQYKGAALSRPIHLKGKRGGAAPGFPV
jgi:hypothetical protein